MKSVRKSGSACAAKSLNMKEQGLEKVLTCDHLWSVMLLNDFIGLNRVFIHFKTCPFKSLEICCQIVSVFSYSLSGFHVLA